MKKIGKNSFDGSIKDLMSHITTDMITRQTLSSLFRCLLETIIESRYDSIILVKLKNTDGFSGLLNRLIYSECKVFTYSDNIENDKFQNIPLNHKGLENDEFLIIIADRFSACLYWNESTSEIFGLCQGFYSLNPIEAGQITEYLQSLSFSEELEKSLSEIRQDRRYNEKFTSILRKLIASLEGHQRDLICANAELKEMHEKAARAENLVNIGQLCSTIAHELRNPLSNMALYAKIISANIDKIEDQKLDSKILDCLKNAASVINNASLGLENILNDLVDYSKPINIDKNENDLEKSLNEVINLVTPAYKDKGVELKLNYLINKSVNLKFDKYKLNQALLNVIKNALEASDKGTIVELSAENLINKVYIKIKDQGAGIDPKNKDKIFTPYFTTKKEGTGLGLARSKKIMEAHGGNLTILSTNNKGTEFVLILPVEEEEN